METKQSVSFSFEQAYTRLEGILSELNSGETPLEESLKLFDKLNVGGSMKGLPIFSMM